MDGEVVHALLRLFDECVAVNFPGKVLGLAADLFERLINRHGADGHGRIAQNPLAGGVDVLAGGKVHDGVRAPFGGPAHFFDLFLDGRRDGAVADVGVDLHEEVAADDHRLGLGMVDVGRDDGAPRRHFGTDEFRRDFARDALWETGKNRWSGGVMECCRTGMLFVQIVAGKSGTGFQPVFFVGTQTGGLCHAHVFADGDEFHFGRDDAGTGVGELGDDLGRLGTQNFPLRQGGFVEVE